MRNDVKNTGQRFVFICQSGDIEIKAVLLAASLHRYLPKGCELIAAIPTPESTWGEPCPQTLAFLSRLNVRLVPIENPISVDYPIGNKVACLNIPVPAGRLTFLDSDMLCLRFFDPAVHFTADFCAKPADLATFGKDSAVWQMIYQKFGLVQPDWRVLATVSREILWPYFNAGLISITVPSSLPESWIKACRRIDVDPDIPNKRPWLDQIGLSVAMAQTCPGQRHILDERFNYPLHLKPLGPEMPFFCHYHWPHVLRREPRLTAWGQDMANRFPGLDDILQRLPEWEALLRPYKLGRPKARLVKIADRIRPTCQKENSPLPEALITGIPRSGTSYLCRLFHQVHDTVVINEPVPIFAALEAPHLPWGMPLFYQELRRDILDGHPVQNKLNNGSPVEDTALCDERSAYLPPVFRPDFLLVTKNTLAYMARLPQLKSVMPHAPIFASVRHPLDAIGSWKKTFPHLKYADVDKFPVGGLGDLHLTGYQQRRLQDIAETDDVRLKRAFLWRHLAELILENQHLLEILQYETLVAEPLNSLKRMLRICRSRVYGIGWLQRNKISASAPIGSSAPRLSRAALSIDERQMIADICGDAAAALGYEFPSGL